MIRQFCKPRSTLPLVLCFLAIISNSVKAQVSIDGPRCIIPGITYQYIISGSWSDAPALKFCVMGGKLIDDQRCTPDSAKATSVLVIWSDTAYRRLEVTSSLGNASLLAMATSDLQGGAIEENDRAQVYDSTVHSYTFHCEVARGGACNPHYTYQWRISEDGLNWTSINGATGKDLQFTGSIVVNTLFQRITTETTSNTVAYSGIGMLTVTFN